jgi:hypothetical protein
MPSILPLVPSVGLYNFDTDIGDRSYRFDVRWNSRDNFDAAAGVARGAWYFEVSEIGVGRIACGVKIVLGTYLGRRVNHPLFREGVLVAVDTSGEGRDATFDDLGTRVVVKHYTSVEIDTIIQQIRARLARSA